MYTKVETASRSQKIIYKNAPLLIILLSSIFSAVGAYTYHSQSDPVLAKVLALIFILTGIVVSIKMSKIEYDLKLFKSPLNTFIFAIVSISWLCISSLYAFSFVALPSSVNAEINEISVQADKALSPVIHNAELVNSKMIPMLSTLIANLDDEIERQHQLGGCRQICQALMQMSEELEMLETKLESDYGEDKAKKLDRLLRGIQNISLQQDMSWDEKLIQYNSKAQKLKRETSLLFMSATVPEILTRAQFAFQSQFQAINAMKNSLSTDVARAAFTSAQRKLATIEKLLIDTKTSLVTVTSQPLILEPITPSFALIFKQIKHTLNLLVLACFPDSLAILFFISNIHMYRKVNP